MSCCQTHAHFRWMPCYSSSSSVFFFFILNLLTIELLFGSFGCFSYFVMKQDPQEERYELSSSPVSLSFIPVTPFRLCNTKRIRSRSEKKNYVEVSLLSRKRERKREKENARDAISHASCVVSWRFLFYSSSFYSSEFFFSFCPLPSCYLLSCPGLWLTLVVSLFLHLLPFLFLLSVLPLPFLVSLELLLGLFDTQNYVLTSGKNVLHSLLLFILSLSGNFFENLLLLLLFFDCICDRILSPSSCSSHCDCELKTARIHWWWLALLSFPSGSFILLTLCDHRVVCTQKLLTLSTWKHLQQLLPKHEKSYNNEGRLRSSRTSRRTWRERR